MSKNNEITIRDVAERAGVSITTVSRVVNGSNVVRQTTVKKVQRAIEELGYIPNEIARGLVTSQNKTIGMLIPDIFNGYYAELTTYIEPYLGRQGFSLQMCITHAEQRMIESYVDDLLSRRAAGMIVVSQSICSEALVRKIKQNIPVVTIESKMDGVSRVYVDSEKGMFQAVENLIRNGHTKIGYVGYDFAMGGFATGCVVSIVPMKYMDCRFIQNMWWMKEWLHIPDTGRRNV